MSMYLISYDLSQPARNYGGLYSAIRSYGVWARITESSWAVVTDQSEVAVRDYLTSAIDQNDKLFVGKMIASAWIGLDQQVHNWLSTHYP